MKSKNGDGSPEMNHEDQSEIDSGGMDVKKEFAALMVANGFTTTKRRAAESRQSRTVLMYKGMEVSTANLKRLLLRSRHKMFKNRRAEKSGGGGGNGSCLNEEVGASSSSNCGSTSHQGTQVADNSPTNTDNDLPGQRDSSPEIHTEEEIGTDSDDMGLEIRVDDSESQSSVDVDVTSTPSTSFTTTSTSNNSTTITEGDIVTEDEDDGSSSSSSCDTVDAEYVTSVVLSPAETEVVSETDMELSKETRKPESTSGVDEGVVSNSSDTRSEIVTDTHSSGITSLESADSAMDTRNKCAPDSRKRRYTEEGQEDPNKRRKLLEQSSGITDDKPGSIEEGTAANSEFFTNLVKECQLSPVSETSSISVNENSPKEQSSKEIATTPQPLVHESNDKLASPPASGYDSSGNLFPPTDPLRTTEGTDDHSASDEVPSPDASQNLQSPSSHLMEKETRTIVMLSGADEAAGSTEELDSSSKAPLEVNQGATETPLQVTQAASSSVSTDVQSHETGELVEQSNVVLQEESSSSNVGPKHAPPALSTTTSENMTPEIHSQSGISVVNRSDSNQDVSSIEETPTSLDIAIVKSEMLNQTFASQKKDNQRANSSSNPSTLSAITDQVQQDYPVLSIPEPAGNNVSTPVVVATCTDTLLTVDNLCSTNASSSSSQAASTNKLPDPMEKDKSCDPGPAFLSMPSLDEKSIAEPESRATDVEDVTMTLNNPTFVFGSKSVAPEVNTVLDKQNLDMPGSSIQTEQTADSADNTQEKESEDSEEGRYDIRIRRIEEILEDEDDEEDTQTGAPSTEVLTDAHTSTSAPAPVLIQPWAQTLQSAQLDTASAHSSTVISTTQAPADVLPGSIIQVNPEVMSSAVVFQIPPPRTFAEEMANEFSVFLAQSINNAAATTSPNAIHRPSDTTVYTPTVVAPTTSQPYSLRSSAATGPVAAQSDAGTAPALPTASVVTGAINTHQAPPPQASSESKQIQDAFTLIFNNCKEFVAQFYRKMGQFQTTCMQASPGVASNNQLLSERIDFLGELECTMFNMFEVMDAGVANLKLKRGDFNGPLVPSSLDAELTVEELTEYFNLLIEASIFMRMCEVEKLRHLTNMMIYRLARILSYFMVQQNGSRAEQMILSVSSMMLDAPVCEDMEALQKFITAAWTKVRCFTPSPLLKAGACIDHARHGAARFRAQLQKFKDAHLRLRSKEQNVDQHASQQQMNNLPRKLANTAAGPQPGPSYSGCPQNPNTVSTSSNRRQHQPSQHTRNPATISHFPTQTLAAAVASSQSQPAPGIGTQQHSTFPSATTQNGIPVQQQQQQQQHLVVQQRIQNFSTPQIVLNNEGTTVHVVQPANQANRTPQQFHLEQQGVRRPTHQGLRSLLQARDQQQGQVGTVPHLIQQEWAQQQSQLQVGAQQSYSFQPNAQQVNPNLTVPRTPTSQFKQQSPRGEQPHQQRQQQQQQQQLRLQQRQRQHQPAQNQLQQLHQQQQQQQQLSRQQHLILQQQLCQQQRSQPQQVPQQAQLLEQILSQNNAPPANTQRHQQQQGPLQHLSGSDLLEQLQNSSQGTNIAGEVSNSVRTTPTGHMQSMHEQPMSAAVTVAADDDIQFLGITQRMPNPVVHQSQQTTPVPRSSPQTIRLHYAGVQIGEAPLQRSITGANHVATSQSWTGQPVSSGNSEATFRSPIPTGSGTAVRRRSSQDSNTTVASHQHQVSLASPLESRVNVPASSTATSVTPMIPVTHVNNFTEIVSQMLGNAPQAQLAGSNIVVTSTANSSVATTSRVISRRSSANSSNPGVPAQVGGSRPNYYSQADLVAAGLAQANTVYMPDGNGNTVPVSNGSGYGMHFEITGAQSRRDLNPTGHNQRNN